MRTLWRAGIAMLLATQSFAAPPQTPPDPSIEPRVRALFDQPTGPVARTTLPPRPNDPNSPGVVRCYHYHRLTVKELDYGDHGDTAISVTPVAEGATPPDCGKQDDPGEIVLRGAEGGVFVGTKGGFVYVMSTMGAATVPFTIYDARTGKALYSDQSSSDGLTGFSVEEGVLTFTYGHGAQSDCSLLTGGQNCWARLAREAHLPPPIAKLPPPIAACEEGYRRSPASARDAPSVIYYDVTVSLTGNGQAKVLSRGAVNCSPQG